MKSKHQFPYLDGFRFFAALLVFVAHFEEFRFYYKISFPNENKEWFSRFGSVGVTVFFVLSGFLITWLLLNELEEKNKIKLKYFYIRRILRIWPLYFLISSISFLILNNIAFFNIPGYNADYHPYLIKIVPFYLMLLPQVPYLLYPAVPYANILWSIGVEELFYFFWPFAVNKKRRVVVISFVIIFLWIAAKFLIVYLHRLNIITQPRAAMVIEFVERNRFYCFSFGSLVAFFYKYTNKKYFRFIQLPFVQIVAAFIFLFSLFPDISVKGYNFILHEQIAALSAVIILGCLFEVKIYSCLGTRLLQYFGKISYGIYCYQIIAIVIVYRVYGPGRVNYFLCWLLFLSSLGITIGLASFSYYFFERKFLTIKNKFY